MARRKKSLDPRNFEGRPDAEILQVITEDMRRAETFQQPYFDKFAEFYRQYNCVLENEREHGSNLFIPYIYNIVETALPKILNSVFQAKPYITYKSFRTENIYKALKLTNLIFYQMKQKMKAITRMYEIYKSSLMYGTAYSKQVWKYQEKDILERKMQEQEVQMGDGTIAKIPVRVPVKTRKVVYDAPDFRNIPVECIYFDPAFTEVDDSPFIVHEYWKELHELQIGGKEGYYKNISKVSEEKQDGPLKAKYDATGITIGDMAHGVRIWEYWTDDWLVTVANKSVVIKVEENPFFHRKKPFIKWRGILMPNEWYGKSLIETLIDLQNELNTIRNQRIDNVSLAINRMFLIAKGAGIDAKQLISRPNGFIEVEDIEKDIKELILSDVTSSAYKDEEIVKRDMDITSGVHNHDRGQPSERRETATVASLLSSASSERFLLQVLMLNEDPFTELGVQLAELNKQFIDDEVFIMVTGEDGAVTPDVITFDDIDIDYDVMPCGTATDSSVNKEVRQSQLIQLLSTAVNNPYINQPELLRQIFKEFNFKEFETMVLNNPPQLQQPSEENTAAAQNQGVAQTSLTNELDALLSGEAAQPQQPQQPQQEAPGLYPQVGGVGAMAQYLQNPNAQP